MMRLTAVVASVSGLRAAEVSVWIERGWVRPEGDGDDPEFADVDVARIRLIRDLRTAMELEDETIPLVLSLLDQVYESRGRLRSVLRAVEAQPASVRAAILAAIG